MGIQHSNEAVLFRNGHIWSDEESRFRRGELLLRSGSIEDITFPNLPQDRCGNVSQEYDLNGGYLCPAFIDGHMHLFQWSISRSGLDLSDCRSEGDIIRKVRSVIDGKFGNEVYSRTGMIFGTDFDDSNFSGGPILDGSFMKKEFEGIPLILRRVCGHKAVLNPEALSALGIPEEECVNGIIREGSAMELPWRLPFDAALLAKLLKEAIDVLHSYGVVGGVDIVPVSQLDRMYESYSGTDRTFHLSVSIIRDAPGRFRSGNLPEKWDQTEPGMDLERERTDIRFEKFFLDGSIGARTASFQIDYRDSPSYPTLHTDREISKMAENSYSEGLVPMVHCIGDMAISQGVRLFEKTGLPYRLEHVEAINGTHLRKMKGGKGALCMQPNFHHRWGRAGGLYEQSLGKFSRYLNDFTSVIGSGIPWCFGTDMMPPDPLVGFMGGMGNEDIRRRLKLSDMILGFSKYSAMLSMLGPGYTCSMKAGSSPDLVVLDRKLTHVRATFLSDGTYHVWTGGEAV